MEKIHTDFQEKDFPILQIRKMGFKDVMWFTKENIGYWDPERPYMFALLLSMLLPPKKTLICRVIGKNTLSSHGMESFTATLVKDLEDTIT